MSRERFGDIIGNVKVRGQWSGVSGQKKIYFLFSVFCFFWLLCSPFVIAGEKEDFLFGQRAYETGLYRLAQRNLERFLKDYPETELQSYAHYYLGSSLYRQKRFKEASKYFKKIISSEHSFPFRQETLYSLVLSTAEIKDFNLGMSSLQKLKEEFPESPYIKKGEEILILSLLEATEIAIKEKEYEKAKRYSQTILNNFPSSSLLPYATYQYGLSLFFLKDYQNSLPHCKNSHQKKPYDVRLFCGTCYVN